MKKYLKLLLFVSSFALFIIHLNAGVCDAHAIVTKKDLYDFDWAVPMDNICQLTKNSGKYDSGCGSFMGPSGYSDAQASCEGAHQHPCTGEISYNTAGCSEESICDCFILYHACRYQEEVVDTCYDGYTTATGLYVEPYCTTKCQTTADAGSENFGDGVGTCLKDDALVQARIQELQAECEARTCKGGGGGTFTYNIVETWKTQYPTYRCDSSTGGRGSIDSIYGEEHETLGDFGDYISAYCVNPDEAVPNKTNVYKIDATKCKNSYSTVDCGYANIMIEGNYRSKILGKSIYGDYAVILTALRLWAVHVGSSGFDLIGLGNVSEDQYRAGDPNEWLRFVPNPDGSFDNFYKLAYHNLMYTATYRHRADYADLYTIDTVGGIGDFKKVKLANASKGVFSDGVNQPANLGKYLYAYQLFLNTLQGNDDMQDHLLALNLNASGMKKEDLVEEENTLSNLNDPVYAYSDMVDGNTIRITYRLRENVEIYCKDLPGDKAQEAGCEMMQKVTIYDSRGNVVLEKDAYDYCEKNVCYSEFEVKPNPDYVVNCDAIDKIVVEVDSYEECGAKSVKKYLDCSNPRDSQMLVSFEADKNCDTKKPTRQKITTFLQCDMCDEKPTFVDEPCYSIKDGEIVNNTKNVKNIEYDKNNNEIKYGDSRYVVNNAQDPSLNCILNKRAFESDSVNVQGRAYYDYSEMFGVNTNLCKVYCRDSVDYYLAAMDEANSSLQIKFDIHSRIFGNESYKYNAITGKNDIKLALTSVIMVERTCVSKTFYDQPFDYNVNWDIEYGVGNDQLLEHFETYYRMSKSQAQNALNNIKLNCGEVTDFKSMYCRVNELAKKENGRRELLNSLLYDLYNCNMLSQKQTEDYSKNPSSITNTVSVSNPYAISRPKDANENAVVYADELIKETNKYCNGDPENGIAGHDCVTGKIRYEGGAQYFKDDEDHEEYDELKHDDSGYTFVGLTSAVPELTTITTVDNNLYIQYCSNKFENGKKVGCFAGSSLDDQGKKQFVDNMEYATKESKWAVLPFLSNQQVLVPSNDFAVFKLSVKNELYNSTKFYSQQFTGNVRNHTAANESIYKSDDLVNKKDKYLTLSDYVYPVSFNAKKVCESYHNIGISSDSMTSLCDINYNFEIPMITTYNREKQKNDKKIIFDRKQYVDEFTTAMGNSNNYQCLFDAELLEDATGFAYKNINLNDPFPFERTKTNWSVGLNKDCKTGEDGMVYKDCDYYDINATDVIPEKEHYKNYIQSVVSEIEESGSKELYATDEYLEYSYRLDADGINAIREYNNESKNGYFDVPTGCENVTFYKDENKEVNYYANCKSNFLEELRTKSELSDVKIIKDDGISEYTAEKKRLEGGK